MCPWCQHGHRTRAAGISQVDPRPLCHPHAGGHRDHTWALREAVRPHNVCSGHPRERHCQPTCLCRQRPNGRAPSHTYLRCQWGRTGPGARCSTGTGGASCSASAAPRAATRVGTGHRLIRRGERQRPAAALACRGASLPSRRRRRSTPASSVTAALLRRRCVMSLRHRPMPSGQNATRSLETGEDRAACESCTEPSTPLRSTHVNCFVAGAKHRAVGLLALAPWAGGCGQRDGGQAGARSSSTVPCWRHTALRVKGP